MLPLLSRVGHEPGHQAMGVAAVPDDLPEALQRRREVGGAVCRIYEWIDAGYGVEQGGAQGVEVICRVGGGVASLPVAGVAGTPAELVVATEVADLEVHQGIPAAPLADDDVLRGHVARHDTGGVHRVEDPEESARDDSVRARTRVVVGVKAMLEHVEAQVGSTEVGENQVFVLPRPEVIDHRWGPIDAGEVAQCGALAP